MRAQVIVASITIVAVAGLIACGGSKPADESKTSSPSSSSAPSVTESAKDMAQGLAALSQGLQQMAGNAKDAAAQKPVDPVSFKDLQAVFPDLDGWTKGKPTGERMSSPVSFSQAQVRYTKGDASMDVKLVDSGFNQLLLAPFGMFLAAGYEKETENGYEKSAKVAGYPGWEKWDTESKDGELNAIVNKRFVLTVEGRGIPDAQMLHTVAEKADLAKLAAMK